MRRYTKEKKISRVQVGDVIKSTCFVTGRKNGDRISIVDASARHGMRVRLLRDESRKTAKFVVISAESFCRREHGSDRRVFIGWYVVAKRLKRSGDFDPNGEEIEFFQDTRWSCCYAPDVRVVGKTRIA